MVKLAPHYVKLVRAPEVFGISVATIHRAAERGEFRIHKPGGRPGLSLVKVAEVEEWLKRGEVGTSDGS